MNLAAGVKGISFYDWQICKQQVSAAIVYNSQKRQMWYYVLRGMLRKELSYIFTSDIIYRLLVKNPASLQ
jgi:hypothetical protein